VVSRMFKTLPKRIRIACRAVPCRRWFGGVVVRASEFFVIEGSQVRLPAGALPDSIDQLTLPSPLVGKSSTSLLVVIKVGRVHLRRVAGNTVIPDGRWHPVALSWEYHFKSDVRAFKLFVPARREKQLTRSTR